MKAVVCERYGPPEVLKIKEVAKPVPKRDEVLVKIMATAVNSADVRVRGLDVPGLMRIIMRLVLGLTGPRKAILGTVFSGVVETMGRDVKNFKPGDKVYGATGMKFGAYAQYITLVEKGAIAPMPRKASFEEAAAIPFGGTTALYFLEKAGLGAKKGQKVLVYGSTGAVGTAGVQIAKHYGADVTAVCSLEGVKLMKSLGVDQVIVYTKEDFTKNGKKYDIIFEAVGKRSKGECVPSLAQGGRFVTTASLDVAAERKEQLLLLSKLYDSGEYKAVIERTYTLEEIVEAHKFVDLGRKKGNVVITIGH